jgi:hypothetical protein
MVAEIYAGLGAFRAMFDMAKGLKNANDAALRNAAVIELQEQILTAQAEQAALIERIGALEKEVAGFEKWDAESQKYELKDLGWNAFAYMLKPDARDGKPPHWVCVPCYGNRKISIVQAMPATDHGGRGNGCPICRAHVMPSQHAWGDAGRPKWLD